MLLLFIFNRIYNYLNEIFPFGIGLPSLCPSVNLYFAVRVVVSDELMIIVRKQLDPSEAPKHVRPLALGLETDDAATNSSVHKLEFLIPKSPMHINRKKMYSFSKPPALTQNYSQFPATPVFTHALTSSLLTLYKLSRRKCPNVTQHLWRLPSQPGPYVQRI